MCEKAFSQCSKHSSNPAAASVARSTHVLRSRSSRWNIQTLWLRLELRVFDLKCTLEPCALLLSDSWTLKPTTHTTEQLLGAQSRSPAHHRTSVKTAADLGVCTIRLFGTDTSHISAEAKKPSKVPKHQVKWPWWLFLWGPGMGPNCIDLKVPAPHTRNCKLATSRWAIE